LSVTSSSLVSSLVTRHWWLVSDEVVTSHAPYKSYKRQLAAAAWCSRIRPRCDQIWTSLFTTTDGSNYNVFTIQTMREKKKKKNTYQ